MGERHRELRMQASRLEALLRAPIELALDHHVDETRAKPRQYVRFRCRSTAFTPVEHQGEALLSPRHRPCQVHASTWTGETAVLARVRDQLMHRHAQSERGIGLEKDI